ncbi:hypothetical protein EBZ39_01570 [bacterium]|nr:hypothetical protein [bacterium]
MRTPFESNPDPLAQLQEGIALLFNAHVIGVAMNYDVSARQTRMSLDLLLPREEVTIEEFRLNWLRLAPSKEKETMAQPGIAGRRLIQLNGDTEVFREHDSQ